MAPLERSRSCSCFVVLGFRRLFKQPRAHHGHEADLPRVAQHGLPRVPAERFGALRLRFKLLHDLIANCQKLLQVDARRKRDKGGAQNWPRRVTQSPIVDVGGVASRTCNLGAISVMFSTQPFKCVPLDNMLHALRSRPSTALCLGIGRYVPHSHC